MVVKIGPSNARRLFMTGETINVDKAREMAQWPVSALVGIKQTLQVANRAGVEAALRVEDEGMEKFAGSPENMEAVLAFMEKRPPDFKKFRR